MGNGVEILFRTPRHVFARWRPDVVVQVRGEELTVEALDAIETAARLSRAQVRTQAHLGALMVIEERAPAPTGAAAQRQREMLVQFNADERLYLCLVLEGSGWGVTLKRTLARAAFRTPRRMICGTVKEGAAWLMQQLDDEEHTAALVDIVASLRFA